MNQDTPKNAGISIRDNKKADNELKNNEQKQKDCLEMDISSHNQIQFNMASTFANQDGDGQLQNLFNQPLFSYVPDLAADSLNSWQVSHSSELCHYFNIDGQHHKQIQNSPQLFEIDSQHKSNQVYGCFNQQTSEQQDNFDLQTQQKTLLLNIFDQIVQDRANRERQTANNVGVLKNFPAKFKKMLRNYLQRKEVKAPNMHVYKIINKKFISKNQNLINYFSNYGNRIYLGNIFNDPELRPLFAVMLRSKYMRRQFLLSRSSKDKFSQLMSIVKKLTKCFCQGKQVRYS